ncbi:CYTH domain-containing protein [Gorillibacterium sp. sgz5001074]|uniref:CYTH domain-containing protein n=1 Tax=Gorillibacterium sp. sgz5001074 TaxID=3446695 RepID=UPI003F673C1D
MNQEIERKYLLNAFPKREIDSGELKVVSRRTIEQTYLALTETEEIRVRKLFAEGSKPVFTHTFKKGHGLSRGEVEYEISAEIYHQLLDDSGYSPLIKTRTKVQDPSGRLIEIDEYHQFDLLTVETEFQSEEEALAFVAPAWFGPEIGSELEYRNKRLWSSVQRRPETGLGD